MKMLLAVISIPVACVILACPSLAQTAAQIAAQTAKQREIDPPPDNAALAAQLRDLRAELKDLRSALADAPNEPHPGSRNTSAWTEPSGGVAEAYPPKICAPGSYAVGLRAWGSPDTTRYPIGRLTGVAVLCKSFPSSAGQP